MFLELLCAAPIVRPLWSICRLEIGLLGFRIATVYLYDIQIAGQPKAKKDKITFLMISAQRDACIWRRPTLRRTCRLSLSILLQHVLCGM